RCGSAVGRKVLLRRRHVEQDRAYHLRNPFGQKIMAGRIDSSPAVGSTPLKPQADTRNSFRGFLYIGAATFFWGFSATLGRAAFTGRLLPSLRIRGIDPIILSQCRTGFSFLALALWLIARRGINALRVPWRDLAKLVLLGLAVLVVS